MYKSKGYKTGNPEQTGRTQAKSISETARASNIRPKEGSGPKGQLADISFSKAKLLSN